MSEIKQEEISGQSNTPNFESIRQQTPEGTEYWSARDLMPLLGYEQWHRFNDAIKRAQTACEQTGQIIDDHFSGAGKMVSLGSKAKRQVKDYYLSRFACYLIGQNGDPRKPEIAAAQVYFATATRENEVTKAIAEQEKRLELRERLSENDKLLAQAAYRAGVLSRNFGQFVEAGYEGLYGGLNRAELKERRGLPNRADVLDYMEAAELAANDFRVTQTTIKLTQQKVVGQSKAIETHREVGQKVRQSIADISGIMPEDLPTPKESIKQLRRGNNRKAKKLS